MFRFSSALLAIPALLVLAAPAAAFNCKIPALVNPSKKAVCGSAVLRSLDLRETSARSALLDRLGPSNRAAFNAGYTPFKQTRDQCGADTRCLDASYRAQLRLYKQLERCVAVSDQKRGACVADITQRHREALHRSL